MRKEISIIPLTDELYQVILRGKGFAVKKQHISKLKSINRLYALILFFESMKMPVAMSITKYYIAEDLSADVLKEHLKHLSSGIQKSERGRISSYINCINKNIQ